MNQATPFPARPRRLGPALAALALLAAAAACAGDEANLIGQDALLARLAAQDAQLVVLDVRTAGEFAEGHVPGARNISHDELGARLAELEDAHDKDVVVYCRSGRRAGLAIETLRQAGFRRPLHLEGDYLGWTAAGREVEGDAAAPDPGT